MRLHANELFVVEEERSTILWEMIDKQLSVSEDFVIDEKMGE